MTQLDRTEMEGSGVSQLLNVLKKSVPPKDKLIYFAKVHSSAPLRIKLDHVPDLLDSGDVVVLDHCNTRVGDTLALLSIDGGNTFIAMGNTK